MSGVEGENVASDAEHVCPKPALAWPGDEWTCPACGETYWADDMDDSETFRWRHSRTGQDNS